MKKKTAVLLIFFLTQILLFSAILFIYMPHNYYKFNVDYTDVTYSGKSEKVKYVVNEVMRTITELQPLWDNDNRPTTTQELLDSEYIDYHLQLVENRKNKVIFRIYGSDLIMQEVSSIYLVFDMTSDIPTLTKEEFHK